MNNTNDFVSVIKSILDYHISTNTDGEYGYIHNEKSNFENIFGYKDRFIIENMSDDLDFYGSIFIRKDFFGHNYEIVFRTANLRIFEEMGCSVILYKYAKRVIAEEKDSLGLELKKLSDMKHYENDSVLDKHDDGKDIWFDEIVSVSDILDLKKKGKILQIKTKKGIYESHRKMVLVYAQIGFPPESLEKYFGTKGYTKAQYVVVLNGKSDYN